MARRAEYQIQVAEVLDSMFTGATFYSWTFLFSCSKASDANIAKISANLWKKLKFPRKTRVAMKNPLETFCKPHIIDLYL